MIGRRGFITGLVAVVAAPAIVRAGSLMPVKVMPTDAQLIEMAERLVNPPIMELFDLDKMTLDKMTLEMSRIMHVPREWMVHR